jgi:hypothetical protein
MEAEKADLYSIENQPPHMSPIQNDKKQEHVIWFENKASLKRKSDLTNQYNIAGLSVYALGHESDSYWKAIVAGLSKTAGKALTLPAVFVYTVYKSIYSFNQLQ